MNAKTQNWLKVGSTLTVLLIIWSCSSTPLSEPNRQSGRLDPTPIERVTESPWWLDGDYIDEADKGFRIVFGGSKQQAPTEDSAGKTTKSDQGQTSWEISQASEPVSLYNQGRSEFGTLQHSAALERIAFVIAQSIAAFETIQKKVNNEQIWTPFFYGIDSREYSQHKKVRELTKSISRRKRLRLIVWLAPASGYQVVQAIMDGYTGHPLYIKRWKNTPEIDTLVMHTKEVIQNLQVGLKWSTWVVRIQDQTAIIAGRENIINGDHFQVRELGQGILDPYTGLQLTREPGSIVATGRVSEKLENGFLRLDIDRSIDEMLTDLIVVKPQ